MNTPTQPPTDSLPQEYDTRTLVQCYLKDCYQRNLSKETVKWYRGYLIPFADLYPELPALPETIQEYISTYNSSDERQHGCFRALRAFYHYVEMYHHDYIGPFGRVRAPRRKSKEKPYLSVEQLRQLLEYPYHYPAWVKPCLYVLADTGARIGEISGLTKTDLLEGEGGSLIRLGGKKGETGKTGMRIVPLSPYVRDMLLALQKDRFFPDSVDWLIRQITAAFKKAGVPGSSGLLRHTFCSLWEGDIVSLRAITGHTNIRMVENYRHNKIGHAIKQHKEHSPVVLINGPTKSPETAKEITTSAPDYINTVVKLAEELGMLKEKARQSPERKNELRDFIKNMPGLPGNYTVAMAKLVLHSVLYNFAMEFVNDNNQALNDGCYPVNVLEGANSFLFDRCLVGGDVPDNLKEKNAACMFIYRTIKLMIALGRGFAAEQKALALAYCELIGPDNATDIIKIFNFHDDWET